MPLLQNIARLSAGMLVCNVKSLIDGISLADLLEERITPDGEDLRRPEAIHLYGVDFMSSSDCLRYFGDYGPSSVEWLNDSACNVVFGDPQNAARAMVGMGKPLPAEAATPEQPGWNAGRDHAACQSPCHGIR